MWERRLPSAAMMPQPVVPRPGSRPRIIKGDAAHVARSLPRACRGAQDTLTRCLRPSTSLGPRSEEHTPELQSLMRISYAVFFFKKKNTIKDTDKLNQI